MVACHELYAAEAHGMKITSFGPEKHFLGAKLITIHSPKISTFYRFRESLLLRQTQLHLSSLWREGLGSHPATARTLQKETRRPRNLQKINW